MGLSFEWRTSGRSSVERRVVESWLSRPELEVWRNVERPTVTMDWSRFGFKVILVSVALEQKSAAGTWVLVALV